MLTSKFYKVILYPPQYPLFAFDTQGAHRHNWNDESASLINILVMVSMREQ